MKKPLLSLSISDLFIYILDINIQSIKELLETGDFDFSKWDLIFENYGINSRVLDEEANNILSTYKEMVKYCEAYSQVPIDKLKILGSCWYNTLKSTLYMVEPILLEKEPFILYNINKLWDIFLEIDSERWDNFIKPLNILKYVEQN